MHNIAVKRDALSARPLPLRWASPASLAPAHNPEMGYPIPIPGFIMGAWQSPYTHQRNNWGQTTIIRSSQRSL